MRKFVKFLAGARLAVFLVTAIILWCVLGTAVPQEGRATTDALDAWKSARPAISMALELLGTFHAFRSPAFFALLALLFINIAACTVLHLGDSKSRRKTPIERTGFILVHISLLGLIAGGLLTVGGKWDGTVLLIEGQAFDSEAGAYLKVGHQMFTNQPPPSLKLKLIKTEITYAQTNYMVTKKSQIELTDPNGQTAMAWTEVNRPYSRRDLFITQDETGYAPGITIRHGKEGHVVMDSFLGLQFQRGETVGRHRDVIPSGIGLPELVFTLFPNYKLEDGKPVWSGEAPANPLLHIVNMTGNDQEVFIPLGTSGSLGEMHVTFKELRRWSQFRVMQDPGYPVIAWSLWLGLAAMLLRYGPGLVRWFASPNPTLECGGSTPLCSAGLDPRKTEPRQAAALQDKKGKP